MTEHKRNETRKGLGLSPHGMKGKQNAKKCSSKKKAGETITLGLPHGTKVVLKRQASKRGAKNVQDYLRKLIAADLREK